MKAIENWVKDIVFYMIFVTMVMNLLPDPKYESTCGCLPGRL